jgi:hypothetical protein
MAAETVRGSHTLKNYLSRDQIFTKEDLHSFVSELLRFKTSPPGGEDRRGV